MRRNLIDLIIMRYIPMCTDFCLSNHRGGGIHLFLFTTLADVNNARIMWKKISLLLIGIVLILGIIRDNNVEYPGQTDRPVREVPVGMAWVDIMVSWPSVI